MAAPTAPTEAEFRRDVVALLRNILGVFTDIKGVMVDKYLFEKKAAQQLMDEDPYTVDTEPFDSPPTDQELEEMENWKEPWEDKKPHKIRVKNSSRVLSIKGKEEK